VIDTIQISYLIVGVFIVYFIISYAYKILKINNVEEALLSTKGIRLINLKHLAGIVLFGAIPFFLVPKYRFLICDFKVPGLEILLMFFLIIVATAFLSIKSVSNKIKSKTEKSKYSIDDAKGYFALRSVFLLAYEFFFRGVLFFTLLEYSGLLMAVLIATSLYVLIHIFDSKQEILGAVPFGIVLCLFSYFSNSIWIPFIIHMALSALYEYSMFKYLTHKIKM
jgi:membrane protease YdiL (CAAX protease family)